MRLEQTIRETIVAESADMDARLQQLVRAGLMPQNTLPLLRKSITKVQSGMPLQGMERDVMATFINSMMFIVLGDDTIFNRARSGARGYATEQVELGEEEQEYDYEGDMAKSQLKSIIANSQRMHDSMSDNTNLPEWVQSKITLAEDYITTAANYLEGEMSEEVQIDELSRATIGRYSMKAKSIADNEGGKDRTKGRELAGRKKWGGTMAGVKKARVMATEDIEIAESNLRVGDYTASSEKSKFHKNGYRPHLKNPQGKTSYLASVAYKTPEHAAGEAAAYHKGYTSGPGRASERGADDAVRAYRHKNKEHMHEEVEQVDEISKATMGRYINKAKDSIDMTSYRSGIKDGTAISSSTPYKANNPLEKKLSKRHKGISMAVKKLTKEESEQIDELSKKTLGSYVNKAAERIGTKGVTAGLKIAADEKSSSNFKDMGKRQKGISRAVNKLTKENIDAVKKMNESYKTAFDTALNEYGIKSPSELDESKRKEFFNYVDQEFKKGDK